MSCLPTEQSASFPNGEIWYSDDGITYTKHQGPIPFGPRREHVSTVFLNKLWVISGSSTNYSINDGLEYFDDIWVTSDGNSWDKITPAANGPFTGGSYVSIPFGSHLWLVGCTPHCAERVLINSQDGINWQRIDSADTHIANGSHSAIEFNGMLWRISSSKSAANTIWRSADGFNWEKSNIQVPFSPRDAFLLIVFIDELWLFGGTVYPNEGPLASNEVWSTVDGVNWILRGHTPTELTTPYRLFAFNNALYIITLPGYDHMTNTKYPNTLWQSTDGVNWIQTSRDAPFSPKREFSVSVFNSRIWVIGGVNGNAR